MRSANTIGLVTAFSKDLGDIEKRKVAPRIRAEETFDQDWPAFAILALIFLGSADLLHGAICVCAIILSGHDPSDTNHPDNSQLCNIHGEQD